MKKTDEFMKRSVLSCTDSIKYVDIFISKCVRIKNIASLPWKFPIFPGKVSKKRSKKVNPYQYDGQDLSNRRDEVIKRSKTLSPLSTTDLHTFRGKWNLGIQARRVTLAWWRSFEWRKARFYTPLCCCGKYKGLW